MKRALIGAAAFLTALGGLSAPALAYPGEHGGWDRGGERHGDRGGGWDHRGGGGWDRDGGRGWDHDRGWDRGRGWDHDRDRGWRGGYGGGWDRGYHGGYGGYHRWSRGDYYPRDYWRSRRIADYRYYGLRRPAYGYGYYRDDSGDILLAGLVTGLVIGVIAAH